MGMDITATGSTLAADAMDVDTAGKPNGGSNANLGGYVTMCSEPADDATLPPNAFALKKFSPVFFWSWNVCSDNCAICRVMLMEPCLNCQVASKNSCVVVWGECNHAFHNCCMSQWLKNQPGTGKCPLCQAEWIIQRAGS